MTTRLLVCLLAGMIAQAATAQDVPVSGTAAFVAGTAPNARPPEAPVVTEYPKDKDWYRAALTGISEPYPHSLWFLDDQGAWFTPFIHPGMTGPYDIRGWHAKP